MKKTALLTTAAACAMLTCLPAAAESDSTSSAVPPQIAFRFAHPGPAPDRSEHTLTATGEVLYAENAPCLALDDIASAEVRINQPPVFKEKPEWAKELEAKGARPIPTPVLILTFSPEGREKLAAVTAGNLGKRLGVFINGQLVMAPKIMQPIKGGSLQIMGPLPEKTLRAIADDINRYEDRRRTGSD